MNPYPFVGLNHFTVPFAISISLDCAERVIARPSRDTVDPSFGE
jgi:hypothetical protein